MLIRCNVKQHLSTLKRELLFTERALATNLGAHAPFTPWLLHLCKVLILVSDLTVPSLKSLTSSVRNVNMYNAYINLSAVDLLYGNVYCFMCGTYVYDDELEQIGRDEADKAAWIAGCGKRKYFEWQPTDLETALLTMTTKRRNISQSSVIGEQNKSHKNLKIILHFLCLQITPAPSLFPQIT